MKINWFVFSSGLIVSMFLAMSEAVIGFTIFGIRASLVTAPLNFATGWYVGKSLINKGWMFK